MDTEKRETAQQQQQQQHQPGLKHLGFVRAAAINTLVCLSNVYDYTKQNSGPLKPAVGTVEGAVTAVVAPVVGKFKGVPDNLLAFLDDKVDVATTKFDKHAPSLAKHVACQVHCLTKRAMQTAQELVHQAQVGGPSAAARYTATESMHFVLYQTVNVWSKLDQVPPFRAAAEVIVPRAAHWSDKYNRVVIDMNQKGYSLFGYVPLVPVDDIARIFKQARGSEGDHVGDK